MQRQLAEQTQTVESANPDDLSFLAGKLFDDRGNRMGASFAAKGWRRWRYYVSRATLTGRDQEAGSTARVSAPQLEAFVVEAVKRHLASRVHRGRFGWKAELVFEWRRVSPERR